jgi:hypothetical protein
VLELAPDASAAAAARSCTTMSRWVTLGRSEAAVWGEFKGSGSKPYQVQVDLRGPVFKCSCPSRKFPCKHGLGIMLVLAERPDAIPAGEAPGWVAEWLAGREVRAQKREERTAAKSSAPADPEAQQKRAAAREAKVRSGLEELSAFLRDVVRQGLASVQARPGEFFEKPAARLVDAQAGGLARRVRGLGEIASSGEGWQSRLLAEIGRIHLIVRTWGRMEQLDPAAQAELRSLIGWTTSQEELMSAEGVKGRWVVAAQSIDQDLHVITQRTWLVEQGSGQPALVLHFAAGNAPLDRSLVVGTQIAAELVYFPGATPLRAIVKSREGPPAAAEALPGLGVNESLSRYADALAKSPWLGRWPMTLEVVPVRQAEKWAVSDAQGAQLKIDPRFDQGWEMLAVSGGEAIRLFGEWDDQYLRPLSVVAGGQFVSLCGREAAVQAA